MVQCIPGSFYPKCHILNDLKEKYTQFHLTVKMKDKAIITGVREKEYLQYVIYNRNSDVYIWYLVASWACEVTLIPTQKRLLQCFFE